MALPTISRWENKVALVTGASIGIGAEISKLLIGHSVNVVGCARNKSKLEELGKECEQIAKTKGVEAKFHAYQCDLTKESEIDGMFQWIKTNLSGVDVCINNAGFSTGQSVLDSDWNKTREMYDLNVLALVKCAKLCISSIEDRGLTDGHVININSGLGHFVIPRSNTHSYTATKFAVTAITEGLRQELNQKKSRIRITSISPAMVDTDFHETAYGVEAGHKVRSVLPSLKPKDVADAVVYALSAPPSVQVHDILFRATGAD